MLELFAFNLIKRGVNAKNILYFSREPLGGKKDLVEVFSGFDQLSSWLKGKKYVFLEEVTKIKEWEMQ